MSPKPSSGNISLLTIEIHRIQGHFSDLAASERLLLAKSFLQLITTSVSQFGGFIDQFSGCTAQVIFEGDAERIIPPLIRLSRDLEDWMEKREPKSNWQLGMALHRAPAPSRSAWTLCSQIENWSRLTGCSLVLSEAVTRSLKPFDAFALNWVGKITLPDGRSFEIYAPESKRQVSPTPAGSLSRER